MKEITDDFIGIVVAMFKEGANTGHVATQHSSDGLADIAEHL